MGLFVRSPAATDPEPITAAVEKMPDGWSRAKPAKYNAHRAITASAQQIDITTIPPNRPYAAWQQEAWTGYEKVGEIHYGLNLVSNIMSRVRLYSAAVIDSDQAPMISRDAAEKGLVPSKLAQDATDAMDALTEDDLSGMLRAFALNISVPGECYLIDLPDAPDPKNPLPPGQEPHSVWTIRSTDEVRVTTGGTELVPMRGSTVDQRILPKDTFIARMWRPSGRYSMEPDSSMLAISDPIEELLILQRLVRSATRSRLNAGMLFMPDGITVANATTVTDPETGQTEVMDPGGDFLQQLMDAMVTPVSDEGSASAVVPMVVTGPGDLGAQIVHKTFERKSDEWLVNRSERALERILQGLDVPKEVVTGLANVKYANAIVIDENLYRANIEPLCLMLVDSLTAAYLRPVLRAKGHDEADLARITVWYDPSEIVTRPSKDQDATAGYDRYLLSPSAWRREHGFADTDAPTEAELAFMLLTQKTIGLPDDTTQALLQVALPEVLGQKREENIANSVVPFPQKAKDILAPGPKANQVSDAAVGENAR
jgi:hypothetical protein